MTRIFISHSHSDEAIADSLIDFLGEAMKIDKEDIRCTSDPNHGLDFSSASISEQLKKDLKNAEALIVIATIDSLRSPWILFEVGSFWTTDKLVAPIIGPGLTFDQLPGPLRGYRSIHIEKEDVFYELGELINQLTEKLNVKQIGASRRKDNKLNSFIRDFRAWETQLSEIAQLQEIEKLEARIQDLEEELSEARSQLEKVQELARSQKEQLKAKIKKLEEKDNEIIRLREKLVELSQNQVAPQNIKSFSFEVLTVNEKGQEIKRETKQASYFAEKLGNNITLEMVSIPGGKFMMGTEDKEIARLVKKYDNSWYNCEKPQHEVIVPPFYMGRFQITQAQWQAIASLPKLERDLELEPSYFKGEKRSVEGVSWEDAIEFCQRLSQKTGTEYRLPSEAEWEYAARAGTTTPFYFGETITTELANYRGTDWELSGKVYPGNYADEPKGQYRKETTAVGILTPNCFGLYDMHGNVWEWCEDDWHDSYKKAPTNGTAWLSETSSKKVIRGGSWGLGPDYCRSASRSSDARGSRGGSIGFRVVCVAPRTT